MKHQTTTDDLAAKIDAAYCQFISDDDSTTADAFDELLRLHDLDFQYRFGPRAFDADHKPLEVSYDA